MKLTMCSSAIALGCLLFSASSVFAQEQSRTARDFCVKVRDGKAREFSTFIQNFGVKMGKLGVAEGTMVSWVVAQAVAPAGRSARCDYHIVMTYSGFPPEEPSPEKLAADMKRAGVSFSLEEMLAKRDELAYLVGMDVWRWHERVGPTMKGGYARVNYDKVSGPIAEWVAMEANGWKQLAEAAAKEHGTSWRVASLMMPGGEDRAYNAMTIDVFPSWEAMGKGLPVRAIWNKVHPNVDMTGHMNRLAAVRDRPRVEVVRLIEVIEKQ